MTPRRGEAGVVQPPPLLEHQRVVPPGLDLHRARVTGRHGQRDRGVQLAVGQCVAHVQVFHLDEHDDFTGGGLVDRFLLSPLHAEQVAVLHLGPQSGHRALGRVHPADTI